MGNGGECPNCGEGILMEGAFSSESHHVHIAGYMCNECGIFYDKEKFDSGESQ